MIAQRATRRVRRSPLHTLPPSPAAESSCMPPSTPSPSAASPRSAPLPSELDEPSPSSVSSSKRRHREVDSRRRQREAELLRRLHALGGASGASMEGADEDNSDVVVVVDDSGKARRRRVQKLDILEQALGKMEAMQRAMAVTAAHAQAPSTDVDISGDGWENTHAQASGTITTVTTAISSHSFAAAVYASATPYHPAPPPQPHPRQLILPSAEQPPIHSPRPTPALSPSVFDLPLDRHVHRCMAEWYEEAYRHSPSAAIAQKVALHWQQAAAAPTIASDDSTAASCSDPAVSMATVSLHQSPPPPLLLSRQSSAHSSPPCADGALSLVCQSLSSSAVLYCRRRAIYWLRVAALSVVEQRNGMPRDVMRWLRAAADLINSLPDHESKAWRRELMQVQAVYCAAYSCFVVVTRTIPEWSRLCKLCAEVQQTAEGVATEHTDDELVSRAQFYALRGYHLALCASVRAPVDLNETAATSVKMTAIAHARGDYLMIAHALYVEAIEHIHHGRYESTVRTALRAWQLCLPYYRPNHPYAVNPLAPIDPGLGALLCAANSLCLLGRLSEAAAHADCCVAQALLNEEPITYQWALGMRCFLLSQLGELRATSSIECFSAYFDCTRSSDQGPTSTLYETCYDLHRTALGAGPDAGAAAREAGERWWRCFQAGESFIIAFSSPLCELLHGAGMWSEGLQLAEQWRHLSTNGQLAFYFPDCHRYTAMFILQKAQQLRANQQPILDTPPTQQQQRHHPAQQTQTDDAGHDFDFSLSPWLGLAAVSEDPWPASPPLLHLDFDLAEEPTETPSALRPSGVDPPLPPSTTQLVLDLHEQAVTELKLAIASASSTQSPSRLLELKALLELIPVLQQLIHLDSNAHQAAAAGEGCDASVQCRLRLNVREAELGIYQRRLRQLLSECVEGNETFSVIRRSQELLASCALPTA